ncbi:hypothetical protein HNO90_000799 [Staphylococcus hominis]|uniref:hypothetical protein n=1 Tax=Staphylococcus TaxID=1279 RepID=UPI0008A5E014|nr:MULTISPECIES: hypothetical protein [Staphylococcus]MBB4832418.1 hypothetical protein [Staphylococcus hominis]MCI2871822.1 hypothetical protein [Staphylococcus hominis]MCI2876092.1 hypothetical protein [Staphylococcus hominis]MCI2890660.1 hypothetical protein [Staphylococcus hominis]MDS3867670.1 hypothetical protein [Staphylococcus hominis]
MSHHQNHVEELVGILKNQCRTAFKFHGEVAIQLFLNELFELPSKVDICVERKRIVEVLKVIPLAYTFKYYDMSNHNMDKDHLDIPSISHINVVTNNKVILRIFIYDVINEEWLFRLNTNIRLPKNSIYFHSLTWDVDYIKPEIVLMYDLLDYQQSNSNYKSVLDALSYYQFVILKMVVGEHKIKKALTQKV